MPNWCSNTLEVTDSNEPFNKLVAKYLSQENGEDMLDFEKVIPYPKCLKESNSLWEFNKDEKTPWEERNKLIEEAKKNNIKECGFESWYEWCVENWGTKWNSCDGNVTEYGAFFMTAWSPPIPVIRELSTLIKHDLRLIYIEEGCGFCGEYIAKADGSVIDNYYESVNDAPQDLLDELGYEPWEDEEE